MKIINQSHEILYMPDDICQRIERIGRVCYQSTDKIAPGSADKFVRALIKRGHESVLEHVSVTVRFITDRAVSHQLVRHRLASFAQESQRYVKYDDVTFIDRGVPKGWLGRFEEYYRDLIENGAKPEEARAVLPNCTKTEIIVTANCREWRTIFKLRCDKAAQSDIRTLMCGLRDEMAERCSAVFGDLI